MKSYPSIPKEIQNISAYAFGKLDGSNIRSEWNKKKGLYKFGSKTQLLTPDQGIIYKSISLIKDLETELTSIALQNKWEQCVFFFEFYGDNSFAGNHQPNDNYKISLIDVSIHKKGMINPSQFIKLFGHLPFCAEVIYNGKIDFNFVEQVKKSQLPKMPLEGVVCKADNNKKNKQPIMFKIKSEKWLNKLKKFCKEDDNLFNKLS